MCQTLYSSRINVYYLVMLKLFAHCWLILSLLVAPVQFAAADIAVLDHADSKCEMMDMAGHSMADMDHSSAGQGGCECPDQCKVSCASAHIGLGMTTVMQFVSTMSSFSVNAPIDSIRGIGHLTELPPPIA